MSKNQIVIPIEVEVDKDDFVFVNKERAQEIVFTLFGECNLRCDFCCDAFRHGNEATVDKIMKRIGLFLKELPTISKDVLDLKVLGGELYQDKFGDDIFDAYDKFFGTILEESTKLGKTVNFHTSTNLIFHKKERVLKLLQKYNIKVRGSFDFVGRFKSHRQVEIFTNNLEYLNENGISVEVAFVATKSNMDAIYNKGQYFDDWKYLYDHYEMQFDYYNDVGVEEYKVTEKDICEFFVYLYKNYPKITNIRVLVENYNRGVVNNRYCNRGIWIDEVTMKQCCDMKVVTKALLDNKQCFVCPYYNLCSGTCYRVFYEDSYCHLKEFYRYLENE